MEGRCENCLFWLENDDGVGDGQCRRFPPSIIDELLTDGPGRSILENLSWATSYPETLSSEWCGEYRKTRVSIDDATPAEWDEVTRKHLPIPPGDR
jgi:hypothetical protein